MLSLTTHESTGLARVNNIWENTPGLFYTVFWIPLFKQQDLPIKREMIRKETFWTYSTDQRRMLLFCCFFPVLPMHVTNRTPWKKSLSAKKLNYFCLWNLSHKTQYSSPTQPPPYVSESELDNENVFIEVLAPDRGSWDPSERREERTIF